MDSGFVWELIGYGGSALIVTSVLQRSIFKLRLIGLLGSCSFTAYSVAIEAYPIAAVNVIVGGIHVYYLGRLLRRPETVFRVLHLRSDSRFLAHFIEFFGDDLGYFASAEVLDVERPGRFAAFLLRDLVPAGLFIGEYHDDGSVEVLVDYATPEYRDFALGRFLYSGRSGAFDETGCDRLWTVPRTPEDATYFRKLGFRPDPAGASAGSGRVVLSLAPSS